MSVYVIALLSMKDRAAYDRYQERFMEVFRRYQGRVLAADEAPVVLEGGATFDKLVLLSFPNQEAFEEWEQSAAYQEILKHRRQGADAVVVLARSFPT